MLSIDLHLLSMTRYGIVYTSAADMSTRLSGKMYVDVVEFHSLSMARCQSLHVYHSG
jgi:hypothetical protein